MFYLPKFKCHRRWRTPLSAPPFWQSKLALCTSPYQWVQWYAHIDRLFHKCFFMAQTPSQEHPMIEICWCCSLRILEKKKKNYSFCKAFPCAHDLHKWIQSHLPENPNTVGRIDRSPLFIKTSLGIWTSC